MAKVTQLGKGFSGKLGGAVFRTWGGKTFVSLAPRLKSKRYRKQSPLQEFHRSRFANAASDAKAMLRDPATKRKYELRAKKLKLPNGYTAALKEILNKPR